MSFNKIAVLGLGKVGHLAAELLVESGFTVTGIDARETTAPFATKTVDLSDHLVIARAAGREVALRVDRALSLVQLYRALGGGWQSLAPTQTGTP